MSKGTLVLGEGEAILELDRIYLKDGLFQIVCRTREDVTVPEGDIPFILWDPNGKAVMRAVFHNPAFARNSYGGIMILVLPVMWMWDEEIVRESLEDWLRAHGRM